MELNGESLADLGRLQALEVLSFHGATIVGGGFPMEWNGLSRLQRL